MVHSEKTTSQEEVKLSRRTFSALEKTAIVALFLNGAVYLFQFIFVWLVVGPFEPQDLTFAIVAVLVAGLMLTRLRWMPLLGVLVVLITSTVNLSDSDTLSTLLHPSVNPGHFGTLDFALVFALLALITSGAAAIQNYHRTSGKAPRWLSSFVTGASCLAVGLLVASLIVAANPVGAAASTGSNGMPAVHVAGGNFLTNVVLVPKGSKLQIIDDDGVEHMLENGSWTSSGTPNQKAEAGAPTVQNVDIKSGTVEIGPFPTAGVFHIFCTIHRGMNLTVVVQ